MHATNLFQLAFVAVILSELTLVASFLTFKGRSSWSRQRLILQMEDADASPDHPLQIETLESLAVSGLATKAANFADTFIFSKLFEKNFWKSMVAITDDEKFARQRLLTPNAVYSGLSDMLQVQVADLDDLGSLKPLLSGKDAWLAFNVSGADIDAYATIAVETMLKRVVFGINTSLTSIEDGEMFSAATEKLRNSGVAYTLIKYGSTTSSSEGKYPYRIVRGELPLPSEKTLLASQDLYRVLSESIDLPKSFDQVYGVGPGGQLDQEILVYMKSQGWPERVQVGLLLGDLMERIEKRYLEESAKKSSKASEIVVSN